MNYYTTQCYCCKHTHIYFTSYKDVTVVVMVLYYFFNAVVNIYSEINLFFVFFFKFEILETDALILQIKNIQYITTLFRGFVLM